MQFDKSVKKGDVIAHPKKTMVFIKKEKGWE